MAITTQTLPGLAPVTCRRCGEHKASMARQGVAVCPRCARLHDQQQRIVDEIHASTRRRSA